MQKRSVTVLAPAKLNLSLDVVGTLPNGYHDLDMVMQTIDLYEKIILKTSRDLRLSLPGSFVPANDKNTAVNITLEPADPFQIQQIQGSLRDGIDILVQFVVDNELPELPVGADIGGNHHAVQTVGHIDQVCHGYQIIFKR